MTYCLIVDDDEEALLIGQQIIGKMGFLTRTAATGSEALVAAKTHLPLLVLLDWNMPDMDGLLLIEQLRRIRDGYRIPIIMCTEESDAKKVRAALLAGAKGYLLKPFTEDDLRKQFANLQIRPSKTIP